MANEKYNYSYSLDEKFVMQNKDFDSHCKLLQMVSPNSSVLECGPAYGIMTKYLKKTMHCKVQIIEYDRDSFEQAMQFADGGICTDIEEDGWLEQFEKGSFDYIIYADILEHLRNPQAVLEKMRCFLKPEGSVLLSVPNVAHGDIILNLLGDQFNYTPTGLLDNTHIHLFARDNLWAMIRNAGYYVAEEACIRKELFTTEQGRSLSQKFSENTRQFFASYPNKDVYQFIYRLTLKAVGTKSEIGIIDCAANDEAFSPVLPVHNLERQYFGKVYFDCGNGLHEKDSIQFLINEGSSIKCKIDLPEGCCAVRLDPVEGCGCMVWNLQVRCDSQFLQIVNFNGMILDDIYIFRTIDPSIYFEPLPSGSRWLEVKAEIVCLEQGIWTKLVQSIESVICDGKVQIELAEKLAETQQVMNETGRQLGEARTELAEKIETLAETQQVMNETGRQLGEVRAELEERTAKLAETQQVMNETGRQLGEVRAELEVRTAKLAETQQVMNETGRQLKEARAELTDKTEEIHKMELLVEQQDGQLQFLQSQLDAAEKQVKEKEIEAISIRQNLADREQLITDIQNSFSWQITRPLYNVKSAIYFWMEKRPFTRKVRKAISILRRQGIKELCHAMKQYRRKLGVQNQIAQLSGIPGSEILQSNNYDGYLPYDSEYQADCDFSKYNTDIKALAFYLPQFHTFPENDMWWGKGFTEWVNVRAGDARFAGHYQPRVPHNDFGYYCLDDVEVIQKQVKLAKQHGIYGFCFYYYWFSGKRLMEKPVDMLLEHPEIDFPFCLCWANENWTRAWDGQNKSVLIAQKYSGEDDEKFILDLRRYLDDPRYIRIAGKPVILVYNPGQIPDCHKSFHKWREVARQIGIGEILIWVCQTANNTAQLLKIEDCIDAEVEFPPHNLWMDTFAVSGIDVGGRSAFLYNYQRIVEYICEKLKKKESLKVPIHHSCMMAWDNTARRKDGWFTYYAFSLQSFYRWVLAIVDRTRKDFPLEERLIFINAWNEWGEGTYLEPDETFGYANINTLSRGIYDLPFDERFVSLDERDPGCQVDEFEKGSDPRIAVQVHMFYLDTLDEIILGLNQIPYAFDCFVSTDTAEKREKILNQMRQKCLCKRIEVQVLPNRGRDVAPFLTQLAPVIKQYDYIAHVHSKKTCTNVYGEEWRKYIFKHLLGSSEYLKRVFYMFEHDSRLGIVMPETYPVLELQAEWGGNKDGVENLLQRMNIKAALPGIPVFPVGNMFWARAAAIQKLFDLKLSSTDFPEEAGQVNGTIAHQIERIWVYVAAAEKYHYYKVFNNFQKDIEIASKKRLGIFVHYDSSNSISEDDVATVDVFSSFLTELVFVTNSNLSDKELNKVREKVCSVQKRENIGFDFGAWRDILLQYGQEGIGSFDELMLLNNSCFPPVFDIREMFAEMEDRALDFWGNTIFPYSSDGEYIHRDCIPEHLQSYFLVFEKKVLESNVFWSFWKHVPDYSELIDVIANCESQLTRTLSDAGFIYQPYITETYYMSQFLNNYAVLYEKPISLLLLKNSFIKKKCYQYLSLEEQFELEWMLNEFKK